MQANAAVVNAVLDDVFEDNRGDHNNRTIVSFILVGPIQDEQNSKTGRLEKN